MIAVVEGDVRERLGAYVFGADEETLEEVVLGMLERTGQTLALVEVGTKALVSERIVRLPTAREVFRGALVSADAGVLTGWLAAAVSDVAPDISQTEFQEPAASALARAVRKQYGVDWGLALLALEAPDPNGDDPPGTAAHAALAGEGTDDTRVVRWSGTTPSAIGWTLNTALDMLRRALLESA